MPSAATSLLTRPATELAELVRSGQVHSRELVEAALVEPEISRILMTVPARSAWPAFRSQRWLMSDQPSTSCGLRGAGPT